ncbi:hypothetical protein [Microvirga roseola]|uniref:hypothetical protein n=1 Tax=Microvirga roseola TaxID=2883126 RepID=UPI001E47F935|nr:hypothetical protein [Microvirga roseola]
MDPKNRIDQAFDADSYAVHGSMRGYKPPAPAAETPMRFTVKPIRNSNYAVPGGDKDKAGGGRGKRENEFQREIQQIQMRTRALEAERQTIGLSAGDTAKAEAAFRLLEAAKEANVAITPTLQAQIDQVAAAYGEASQKIEDAEEAHRNFEDAIAEFGSIASGALSGFISDLREGKDAAEALETMLSRVADRLIDMALDSLFGGGNFLDSLLGGGGGLSFNPTGRASGGLVKPGTAYTVGESGRETFVPTTPGRIIPNGKSGGGMQVIVNNHAGVQVSTRQERGPNGDMRPVLDLVKADMVRERNRNGSFAQGFNAGFNGRG